MGRKITHGGAVRGAMTPTYKIWAGMKKRCNCPSDPNFALYGAKGIRICERWTNYENFLADMGERPQDMTIDRIDNDKGYSPTNCRWATRKEQSNNQRSNVMVSFFGLKKSRKWWGDILGITYHALRYRLRNWPLEQALSFIGPARKREL